MKGEIKIEGHKVECCIGVYLHEKTAKQPLLIDLDLTFDLKVCIKSDALQDTLDYDKVTQSCSDFANTHSYNLIEKLAFEMLEMLFKSFPFEKVKIRIYKPNALLSAQSVSIQLEKTR